jgi:hypothetical protein
MGIHMSEDHIIGAVPSLDILDEPCMDSGGLVRITESTVM